MSSVHKDRTKDSNAPNNFFNYARAVKKNLFPLSQGSTSTSTPPSLQMESSYRIPHKRAWLRSSEAFTVFFDTSNLKCTPGTFHRLLRSAFPPPVGLGLRSVRDKGTLYYEISLASEEACIEACTKGLEVEGTIHTPFRGLPNDKEILAVYLKNIPLLSEEKIHETLRQTLGQFGDVEEIILYREPNGNWFMGEGMAILGNVHPASFVSSGEENNTSGMQSNSGGHSMVAPLTHKIDWGDGQRMFYASWKSMPLVCRYCHESGHSRADCPVKKTTLRCFRCNKVGHIRAECPDTYKTVQLVRQTKASTVNVVPVAETEKGSTYVAREDNDGEITSNIQGYDEENIGTDEDEEIDETDDDMGSSVHSSTPSMVVEDNSTEANPQPATYDNMTIPRIDQAEAIGRISDVARHSEGAAVPSTPSLSIRIPKSSIPGIRVHGSQAAARLSKRKSRQIQPIGRKVSSRSKLLKLTFCGRL
ncbi:hypothetical protein BC941DRAFT_445596 [Chlamydoabsidia padenii]|nr:hypothetical protein BC941DRAFT_445596 [Chlamydoabsidia padenii]